MLKRISWNRKTLIPDLMSGLSQHPRRHGLCNGGRCRSGLRFIHRYGHHNCCFVNGQHLADDCDIDQHTGVGVELLTKPGLFFSDEPISGLDPDMEIVLMQLVPFLSL